MQKDKFTVKAKRVGFRARSIFKLFDLNKKYNLIKKDDLVLDLGAWPGSWMQAVEVFGAYAVGVDIKKIDLGGLKDFYFIRADVTKGEVIEEIEDALGQISQKYGLNKNLFDVVISDLAPTVTGIAHMDQYNSYLLAKRAFEIAGELLKPNGNFLCKIFQGPDADAFLKEIKEHFQMIKTTKPLASKKHSKEIYVVGIGFKS